MLYPILLLGAALASGPRLSIGAPARGFALPAVNADVAIKSVGSATVKLHDLVGLDAPRAQKAVVLHFFEVGAGDHVLGGLSRLDQTREDITVIGVLSDVRGLSSVNTWVTGKDLAFPVVFDEHRVVFQRYAVDSSPLTVVVDGQGNVHAIGTTQGDAFQAELEAVLASIQAP